MTSKWTAPHCLLGNRYLDLPLGFQLRGNGPLLEGELAGGRHCADEALQHVISLVPKEEHQLPLRALEVHLQAHLHKSHIAQRAHITSMHAH